MHVIAYTRRSTDHQDASHEAQLHALHGICHDIVDEVKDTCSGSVPFVERPGGAYALDQVRNGEADALAVSKLDRLCRSVLDGAALLQQSQQEGWSLIILDCGGEFLDTSTSMGKAMVHVMLAFAELEREQIVSRVHAGLENARRNGKHIGRPRMADDDTATLVLTLFEETQNKSEVARRLNAQGIPTPNGGKEWRASSVGSVLRSCTTS